MILRLRRAQNGPHSWHVVTRHASSQRIRHQFLGKGRSKYVSLRDQHIPKAGRTIQLGAICQFAGRIDSIAAVECTNGANAVQVLEREADRIHRRVTGCANGICTMLLQADTQRDRLRIVAVLWQRRHVRRRLRRRSAEQIVQDPLSPQNWRGPCRKRGHGENAAMSKQAAPGSHR